MLLQCIGVSKAIDWLLLEVSIRQLKCYETVMGFMSQNITKSRKFLLSSFLFSCVSRGLFFVYILCSPLLNISISLLEGRDQDMMLFWRHENFISTFSSFQQGQI